MISKNVLNSLSSDIKQNISDRYLLSSTFRNVLINGDFLYNQRSGGPYTTNGYGPDRWLLTNTGSTKSMSFQPFSLGQTEVPGNPAYFCRHVVTSVAGTNNAVSLNQRIENVSTLNGQLATLTFWAKADSAKNIAVDFSQYFGSGGSPSAGIDGIATRLIALTTAWTKYSYTVTIPSIAGKFTGTNVNDFLGVRFWFDAGSAYNSIASNLGQQSGTFDIAHVSLVAGDATNEFDPFSPRNITTEGLLCKRYYEALLGAYSRNITNIATTVRSYTPFNIIKRAQPTIAVDTGAVDYITIHGISSYQLSVASGTDYNPGYIRASAEL